MASQKDYEDFLHQEAMEAAERLKRETEHPATSFGRIDAVEDLPERTDRDERLSHTGTLEGRNNLRARFAVTGVKAYAGCVGLMGEEPETAIGDLLSDLHHLCDALGLDYDQMLAKGYGHYNEELVEDGY